jgi:hypothetical protein
MAKKKARLVIAAQNEVRTTSISSQGGRLQLREPVTGTRSVPHTSDGLQSLPSDSAFDLDQFGDLTDMQTSHDHGGELNKSSVLCEVKETERSKSGGIKIERKPRNPNSVSIRDSMRKSLLQVVSRMLLF